MMHQSLYCSQCCNPIFVRLFLAATMIAWAHSWCPPSALPGLSTSRYSTHRHTWKQRHHTPTGLISARGSAGNGGVSPGGALRTFELMRERDVVDTVDGWIKACERDVEVFAKDDDILSKKERVERVFRAVVSEERLEVLHQMRKWVNLMMTDKNNMVLGATEQGSNELTAMAALEACVTTEKGTQAQQATLRVLSVAVCPDSNPAILSGGWTPSEDYSALQMVEGVVAMARDRKMIADFSPLQDVHEGRVYLKSDPFSSKGITRGIL